MNAPRAILMLFFPGLHHPADARHFERAFISVNAIRGRKSDFPVNDWIEDSGAFTKVTKYGGYPEPPSAYAAEVNRLAHCGNLLAAVSEDYMCEQFVLDKTGLAVRDHQRLTIERFVVIRDLCPTVYVMPVLQGYALPEYLEHLDEYGDLLPLGAWVGVGSVCKRNVNIAAIEDILCAIKRERPDLRLHGFGVKITALRSATVFDSLYSADSMAWSFAARKEGRDANDWREAKAFARRIETQDRRCSLQFN